MESRLETSEQELAELFWENSGCKGCECHAIRKTLCRGFGNPNADVLFVLDRMSPQDLSGVNFPSGGGRKALDLVFDYLGHSIEEFFICPPAGCPSDPLLDDGASWRRAQIMPTHNKDTLSACRTLLHEQVRIVEPEIIVAMGSTALKALYSKKPPTFGSSVGRVLEVPIKGVVSDFNVPVMVTYSPVTLYRTSIGTDPEGLWEGAIKHISEAIGLAAAIRDKR